MLFNSIPFLFFFPIVTALYFLLPYKFRWLHLLIASCVFYMMFIPVYIFILFFTIIIDYVAGIYIEKSEGVMRKRFLIMSIVANVGVLAVFKYYNFFIGNFNGFFHLLHVNGISLPILSIILPIGLSFHTFQAMSYTIEVYRGGQKAEKHFGIYALYVMFYPQLVAGPIERPQNMLHQFHEKKYFNYENAVQGMNLIAYGLFKKMVIADRLGVYVDQVYNNINGANTTSALIAAVFYSFQIYCDFSGYSDIARGCARFMGYDLMVNFNRPYSAKSVSEFWTRWHISLSTWFKDYVYIPLGGNRVMKVLWLRNLFIVFLISGLWHGAKWTFVFWGALHGVYLVVGILTKNARTKFESFIIPFKAPALSTLINQLIVFALVTVAWIFFRAPDFSIATKVVHKITELNFRTNLAQLCADKGPLNLILSFFVIALLFLSYYFPREMKPRHSFIFISITVFLIIVLGKDVANEFIYFQF